MSTLSRLLPHQRALAYGLAPKHATSPKDLGAYSPREIFMRKPISAHECLLPCTCSGFASLTNTGNKSPPQAREATLRPQEGSAPSGKPTPPTRPKSRQAKSSARAPQEFSLPLTSTCRPSSGFFLSHTPWTACASKGGPRAPRLESPYLSKP